jgi:hypothetical protein
MAANALSKLAGTIPLDDDEALLREQSRTKTRARATKLAYEHNVIEHGCAPKKDQM